MGQLWIEKDCLVMLNQLNNHNITKEQIVEKIMEMICDLNIEEQLEIMDEITQVIHDNLGENISNCWESYSFGV